MQTSLCHVISHYIYLTFQNKMRTEMPITPSLKTKTDLVDCLI